AFLAKDGLDDSVTADLLLTKARTAVQGVVVAVVAALARLKNAVAASGRDLVPAIGAATVPVRDVAVVAFLAQVGLDDAVAANLAPAEAVATVQGAPVAVVTLLGALQGSVAAFQPAIFRTAVVVDVASVVAFLARIQIAIATKREAETARSWAEKARFD